ncbi:MAG TPA: hypothetical protein VGJ34_02810 [Gaiellaceae bacterium]
MDSRQQRVAENEALFRKVNERIEEVNEELGSGSLSDFLCECGDDDCTQPVRLTLAEYEEVRAEPTHFVIAPGHDVIGVERVIRETDRFAVVEKFTGEAERIAVETDPRT